MNVTAHPPRGAQPSRGQAQISFYAAALRARVLAHPDSPWIYREERPPLRQALTESTWCEESREILAALHAAFAGPPTPAQLALLDHFCPPLHAAPTLQ